MEQIKDVSHKATSKTQEVKDILASSKTGNVLKTGGENLSARLENLLNSSSSDLAAVKGIGKQILTTIEKVLFFLITFHFLFIAKFEREGEINH